jgi:hypothetical protein
LAPKYDYFYVLAPKKLVECLQRDGIKYSKPKISLAQFVKGAVKITPT